MVSYPISIKRNPYRGSDARKKAHAANENQIADSLERHINAQIRSQTEPIKNYLYGIISAETGISENIVRKICFSIDCGGNGFTAIKYGMSYEEAMREFRSSQ